jgi:ribosome-binding protein aMBF1 (putative translation factor)
MDKSKIEGMLQSLHGVQEGLRKALPLEIKKVEKDIEDRTNYLNQLRAIQGNLPVDIVEEQIKATAVRDIGKFIKATRTSQKLSQSQLSKKTHPRISPSYISNIETGRLVPSRDRIKTIAKALDVDLKQIDMQGATAH